MVRLESAGAIRELELLDERNERKTRVEGVSRE
jgi:hypothetical protein